MTGNGSRVRIGLAGLGSLAREVHLPVLRNLASVSIEAVADPDPAAQQFAGASAPGARVYRSLDDLLQTEARLDGVLVATPTAEHARHARLVLETGKALYLEKPLATKLSDGAELVRLAGASRQPATIGFNYRFHPLNAQAQRRIARDPGQIRRAKSAFCIAPRPLPGWKRERGSGGGVLLDLASHHFDLLRFLVAGNVTSVRARVWSERTEDDCSEVELTFDNGVQAHGSYSFCRTEQDVIELSGDNSGIRLDRYAPLRYPIWPLGEFAAYQWERTRSPWKEVSFRRSLEVWIDCIKRGSTPPVTLADGLDSLRVVAAAEESARTGASVETC